MDDHDFWYRIAAWAFGFWGIMIPIGVAMIRSTISKSNMMQEKFLADFHAYVLSMERRMVRIEERMKINGPE